MDGQRAGIAIPNHAKLDEILNALGDARNEISRMDEEEPEEATASAHAQRRLALEPSAEPSSFLSSFFLRGASS
jgi:hypothetical protein